MPLIRKTFMISIAQARAIKRLAQQQETSEAEILRQALDQFLACKGRIDTEDPFAAIIGMFNGPSEVNHDDIYQ